MPSGLTAVLASPQAAPLLGLLILTFCAVWFGVSQARARDRADTRADAAIAKADEERSRRIKVEDELRKELRELRDEVADLKRAVS